MDIKKALCAVMSALFLIMCLIATELSGFTDDTELNYKIGTEYTAQNDADTYFFDESFGSDVAVNAMKLIASVTVVDFNSYGGFGLKFIINNNSNSDDFYFLTMNTNAWAATDTKDPIETETKGTYTLEFDLSKLGQVASIQGDLWQGTMVLNGLQILGEDNQVLTSYGNIIEPTVGYYKAGKGKVKNTKTVQTTTTQTSTSATTSASATQTVSVATTVLSNDIGSGFSFWYIAIPALAIGILFIVLAIVLTKKMK